MPLRQRLKILHVVGRMDRGGAEMRLVELIEHLATEFHVDVCALSGRAGALDSSVAAAGGRVVPLPIDTRFPGRFFWLLRAGRYDVVHSHVLYSSGPVLALAAIAGVRARVAHFHTMSDTTDSTLARRLQRGMTKGLVEHCATDIIACGEGAMDGVWHPRWRQDPRCRVLYDAIDPAKFEQSADREAIRAQLGISEVDSLFLHVANVTPAKNHHRLVRIFAAIRERTRAAWLVLVGAGTNVPGSVLARQIRALGLEERTIALGVRDDVHALLKAADTLLLPSLVEGLPGVVLEACAVGLPVLASDLPGVREIAARLPGVYSLPLAEPDDEWARVAHAVSCDAERLQLRDDAVARFRRSVFHIDRAAEAHRALWRARVRQSA